MPYFSERSKENLSTCHEDIQKLCNEAIKYFDFTVLEGHRDKETQNKYYDQGYSKLKWPQSYHNKYPSRAVDVVPWPIEWDNLDRMKYFIGFMKGIASQMLRNGEISHRVISGIDWDDDTFLKDTNFFDHPHLQIIK